MSRASVLSVGCRLNQSEGDALKRVYRDSGYEMVEIRDKPSLVLINTCTVTKEADRTSLNLIYRATRLRPKPEVVVTGCLVQRDVQRVKNILGVDRVFSLSEKAQMIENILVMPDRSRATLKIEDGCDNSCSFCIASRLRGGVKSKPLIKIKKEIEALRDEGYREVVLVGLNLCSYGKDISSSLVELLKELSKIPELPRIRLGSLQPDTIDDELLELFGSLPLCRHLHISLQSGDDKVLRDMGRDYISSQCRDLIMRIHKKIPGVCLGADVIVGFPSEDEDAFLKIREYLESLPFSYFHIFSYSPRPDTPAYRYGDPVLREEKKRRVRELRKLSQQKSCDYRRRFVGKTLEAIAETRGYCLTDNYIRVSLKDEVIPKSLIDIKITQVLPHQTRGGGKVLKSQRAQRK